jgi:hypothetical protein
MTNVHIVILAIPLSMCMFFLGHFIGRVNERIKWNELLMDGTLIKGDPDD